MHKLQVLLFIRWFLAIYDNYHLTLKQTLNTLKLINLLINFKYGALVRVHPLNDLQQPHSHFGIDVIKGIWIMKPK